MRLFGKHRDKYRPASDRAGAAFEGLEMFLDAALVWVEPKLLSTRGPRTLTRLFFVGAVNALSLRYRLGESGTGTLAEKAFTRVGFTPDELARGEETASEPVREEALSEGRQVMESWLDGDTDAPMRLAQLVRQWTTRP
jgi:hypothetical protein